MSNGPIRKLVFAKRLLRRAEALIESASLFGPAEAVMAAQDGVELVLWEAAKNLGSQPTGNKARNFMEVVDAVPTARDRHRKQLDELNKLRVSAKHDGTIPDIAEARRVIGEAWRAASDVCQSELTLDLAHVHLSELLENRYTAELLSEVEDRLDESDTWGTVVRMAGAYSLMRKQIAAALRDARFFENSEEERLVAALQKRRRDDDGTRAARKVAEQLQKFAERVQETLSLIALGLGPEDIALLQSVLPHVTAGSDGRLHAGPARDYEPTVAELRRAFLILVDLAERADRVAVRRALPFGSSPLREADAFLGDPTDLEKRVLLSRLRPDRTYSISSGGSSRAGYLTVRLFGWSALVEEDAF